MSKKKFERTGPMMVSTFNEVATSNMEKYERSHIVRELIKETKRDGLSHHWSHPTGLQGTSTSTEYSNWY